LAKAEALTLVATPLMTAVATVAIFSAFAIAMPRESTSGLNPLDVLAPVTALWLTWTTYMLPFALLIGAPVFVAARPLARATWPSITVAVLITAAAADSAYPMVEQCDVSIATRPRLIARLSAEEAATLEAFDTWPIVGDMCSLSFRFKRGDQWREISVLPDIIHGPKIFEGPNVNP